MTIGRSLWRTWHWTDWLTVYLFTTILWFHFYWHALIRCSSFLSSSHFFLASFSITFGYVIPFKTDKHSMWFDWKREKRKILLGFYFVRVIAASTTFIISSRIIVNPNRKDLEQFYCLLSWLIQTVKTFRFAHALQYDTKKHTILL